MLCQKGHIRGDFLNIADFHSRGWGERGPKMTQSDKIRRRREMTFFDNSILIVGNWGKAIREGQFQNLRFLEQTM